MNHSRSTALERTVNITGGLKPVFSGSHPRYFLYYEVAEPLTTIDISKHDPSYMYSNFVSFHLIVIYWLSEMKQICYERDNL